MLKALVRYHEGEVDCVCVEDDKCVDFDESLCEKCFIKILPYTVYDEFSDNVREKKSSIEKLGKNINKEVYKINKISKKLLK